MAELYVGQTQVPIALPGNDVKVRVGVNQQNPRVLEDPDPDTIISDKYLEILM